MFGDLLFNIWEAFEGHTGFDIDGHSGGPWTRFSALRARSSTVSAIAAVLSGLSLSINFM